MIKVEVNDLLKSLDAYYIDTVRRLEQMVRGFSYEIALTAIEKTPLGDAETYAARYANRERLTGLQPVAGFARGSWQVALDGTLEVQELYSGTAAASAVQIHMLNYKLGEQVIIGNTGPYIEQLENNYSIQTLGEGILKPTLDSILQVYKADLLRYYKQ